MAAADRVVRYQTYLHGAHLQEMRAGRFTFLNRTVDLGPWPALDWRVDLGEANNPLWRMNLSYFGYLVPMLAEGRLTSLRAASALIKDFDMNNGPGAPGALRDAWTPFSTAIRIVNLLTAWTAYRRTGGPPDDAAEQVIAEHVRRCAAFTWWLREEELGFNHLLKNFAGLAVYAGCADGPLPWQDKLSRALPACADRQILPDGGHVERSPMYQALMLQDLEVAAECWPPVTEALAPVVDRTRTALSAMLHPDREIALFNDAWIGEAPPPADLGASPQPEGMTALRETGYARPSGRGDAVLFDAGPVGPDSNPGHAHGDFLSFELSVHGERRVVDTGTPTYTAGSLRDACRSAHAHNGPRLDKTEPIEAWASFRVGARGTAWLVEESEAANLAPLWLAGVTDGYWRQAGIMTGRWLGLWPGRQLLVVDRWSKVDARARTSLLLAPSLDAAALHSPERMRSLPFRSSLRLEVLRGQEISQAVDWHWPRFGAAEPVTRITLAPEGETLLFRLVWGEPVAHSITRGQAASAALAAHLAERPLRRQR